MSGEHREGIRSRGTTLAGLDDVEFIGELRRGELVTVTDNASDKNPVAFLLTKKEPIALGDFIALPLPVTTTVTASSITLDHSHHIVLCDTSSNAITVNLPAAADYPNKQFTIKVIDATNNVTIDGNASETIDGATTVTLSTQYQSRTVVSDGNDWHVIGAV